jgi:hypothetical protein
MAFSARRTSQAAPYGVLRALRLAIRLRASSSGELPPSPGAVLRGAFGAALRQVCCPTLDGTCGECAVREACAYLYLFETPTPPDADRLRSADHVPHPFVLRPWEGTRRRIARGEVVELELLLVGRASGYLPHLVVALGRMAALGLGRDRVPLVMSGIDQLGLFDSTRREALFDEARQLAAPREETILDALPASPVGELTLELVTPTHIVSDGRPLEHLELRPLARALLRRMSSLAAFHCGAPLEVDYRGLADRAGSVRVAEDQTRFQRASRYSSRQGRRVPLEGVVGRIVYQGDALDDLVPLLALGEALHVGKGTALGMGRYRTGLFGPSDVSSHGKRSSGDRTAAHTGT